MTSESPATEYVRLLRQVLSLEPSMLFYDALNAAEELAAELGRKLADDVYALFIGQDLAF